MDQVQHIIPKISGKKQLIVLCMAIAMLLGNAVKSGAQSETSIQQNQNSIPQRIPFPLNDIIHALGNGTKADKIKAMQIISERSGETMPPLFYLGARTLYQQGKIKTAVFWLLAGELRSQYDLARCTKPKTAQKMLDVLQAGVAKGITDYLINNPKLLGEELPKVLAWDAKTKYAYDPRWICFENGIPNQTSHLLKPENKWPLLRKAARTKFKEKIESLIKTLNDPAKKEAYKYLRKLEEKKAFALAHNQAYTPSAEEQQKAEQARAFIADPNN